MRLAGPIGFQKIPQPTLPFDLSLPYRQVSQYIHMIRVFASFLVDMHLDVKAICRINIPFFFHSLSYVYAYIPEFFLELTSV